MGISHLRRLERAAALLAARGYDTRETVLACYSGAGFDPGLREQATRDPNRIRLFSLQDLYTR
jgi:hypothetical protein